MTAPPVSIITPSFNRQKLLEAQHRIVTAQSVIDFEWLILDDRAAAGRLFRADLGDPRIHYHPYAGPHDRGGQAQLAVRTQLARR